MAPNEVISDLLLRWEELRTQGHDISPDELCRACPEHVPELRERIEAVLRVYGAVEAPDPDEETLPPRQPRAEVSPNLIGKQRPVGVAPPAALADAPAIPGYEILEELGRGGMGVVYKARHVRLDRLVALKMILAMADADGQLRARFEAEARAVARLRHPNIVQIYEVGEHEGQPFLALEFVEGGSLARALTTGQWPAGSKEGPRRAAELVATLADAVQHAHDHGVLHRDLKPANILLSGGREPTVDVAPAKPSGGRKPPGVVHPASPGEPPGGSRPPLRGLVPKITDFGLAKILAGDAGLTQTGMVLGTPAYMPPEQAAGSGPSIVPGSDVFALGAILYRLLTGRPPYEGNMLDVLAQAASGEIVPPRQRNPRLPTELDRICRKALQPDPQRRYPRAADLGVDLRRFLDRNRRLRRNFLAAAAALLAVITGAALWFAPWGKRDGPGPANGAGLQTDQLVLRIWSPDKSKKGLQIGLDPRALPARFNDSVRVEVQLNRPAHLYLLILDAQGQVTPLYPWHRDTQELNKTLADPPPVLPPQSTLVWPSPQSQTGLPLDNRSGLETILVLATQKPIRDPRLFSELIGPLPLPPAPLGEVDEFAVRGGGAGQADESARVDFHRGVQKRLQKIDAPLEKLLDRLGKQFELVRAVRFADKGTE